MKPLVADDPAGVRRWSGSTALAIPATPAACAWCGDAFTIEYAQPALFIHGGYGATTRARARWCSCGALNRVDLHTENPRPRRSERLPFPAETR